MPRMFRHMAPLSILVASVIFPHFHGFLRADEAADSETRLRTTVGYLASDELGGRGIGTKGIDQAADYLAQEFGKMGLKTDLFDGQPFQKFTVNVATELGPIEKNRLALIPTAPSRDDAANKPITLELDKSFSPLAAGGSAQFSAPLVFVGYGITAMDLKYDDYAGLNVEGKIVVILRKEPQQQDEKSPFDGKKNSQYATFSRKIANASEHGAKAVIFINDALDIETRKAASEKQLAAAFKTLEEAVKAAQAAGGPATKVKELAAASDDFSAAVKEAAGPQDKVLPLMGAGDESSHKDLPVIFCLREVIDSALKQSGKPTLAELEAQIDSDLQPRSFELANWKAEGEVNLFKKTAEIKNVIVELPGSGPQKDETIVIGAHYDHLGMGGAGSLAPWTVEIHNGADDNGSGTATLVEVARRITSSGKKPNRRIVFMAFTGEERGLLGSAHYVREPRFALENTVAMFNLDMVGRLTDNKLIVYGTGTAKEFDPLVEALSAKGEFQLTKHTGGFGPSDHSSFYAKKIPVLHLFTGTHTDYHRPSDDTDKLNISGMRRVADLLVAAVEAVDAAPARPEYVEIKQVESIGGGDSDRPYLGTIPDFASNVEGLALTGVSPSGPAAKAGIKGGDVIIKIGESKIAGIEDLEGALRKNKPGDKVKIVVKRGTETIEVEATLTARPR